MRSRRLRCLISRRLLLLAYRDMLDLRRVRTDLLRRLLAKKPGLLRRLLLKHLLLLLLFAAFVRRRVGNKGL